MVSNVGIVIVSHSPDIAKGTADMVRQIVGSDVAIGFCGGNPDGGLGTSVENIIKAIDVAWSERGVAILIDLGGAETNSEAAVKLMPVARRNRIVICNAPIVEGAVMAATEAWGGGCLEDVCRAAEELSSQ
jgi:phosphoenolpyruvate---glycerone phosphotransferase subunit DhaM